MHTEAVLRGERVVLVPSTPDHVERYYRWMTDPRLLKETGTDPLTLDQVYDMEKHWREDGDKLTFIILANGETMVGDVNIFLKGDPSDEDFEAEVGVMIAEESYRGRGLALEALRLMLCYVTESRGFNPPIRPESLVARIGEENGASTRLFERLGFVVTRATNAFGEKEMRMKSGSVLLLN